jgi:tetratricopeptide (TPR) repeat protein
MLFDLQSGRRRTLVRIVYSLLAASFLIGFVIFGVGSNGVGGIGDLFGGGSDSGNAAEAAYQAQIDDAEKQLKQDPKDQQALVNLARYRYLSGTRVADTDSSGTQVIPTDDTLTQWNLALDAWEKYLKTDPKEPDVQVAPQMVQAYRSVGDAEGAAKTQQLIVEEQPNAFNYAQLAYFLYAEGKLDEGKAAADTALSKSKGSEKKQLAKALDKIEQQATALAKAQKQQGQQQGGSASSQLQDPFGGLDTGGGAVAPAAP